MKLPPLLAGRFLRRVNRFRVVVSIGERVVDAHLPNSGRLRELLTEGRRCWMEAADKPGRVTDFDLKLIAAGAALVCVDARLPNPLFAEAVSEGRLTPFDGQQGCDREVVLDESRIDFRLQMPDGVLWVETKSVTLVEGSVARFPDAPTARGIRHLQALTQAVDAGEQAAVVFVVQRPDARAFAPNDRPELRFGEALRTAVHHGVGVYAWTCSVSTEAITIARRIPLILG